MKGRKTDILSLWERYEFALETLSLEKAFTLLREQIVPACDDGHLREEALTLCDSYNLMLESIQRADSDPNRRRIFEQIAKWGYEIGLRILLHYKDLNEPSEYHQLRREQARQPRTPFAPLQQPLTMKTLDELFEKIWTSGILTESEAHELHQIAQSPLLTAAQLCVIVSALTLSLIDHFDERKYLQLLGLCCHRDLQVSQRALVGICLTVQCNYYAMPYLDSVWDAVSLLSELPHIKERLQCIQLEFIHASIAREIAREMQNNVIVIPHRDSLHPEEGEEPDQDLLQEPGETPMQDASSSSTKSTPHDSIRQIMEWQRAGEDVYLSSFSNLKHYSFFLDTAHWFYPFDEENPYVSPILEQFSDEYGRTLRYLLQSVVFCDSDKYSFCLSLKTMNESQIGLFVQQLNEQHDAVMDHVTYHNSTRRRAKSSEEITRHYVHDLNRYFKYWRYAREHHDPLNGICDFHQLPMFSELMTDNEFSLKAVKLLRRWGPEFYHWNTFYLHDLEHVEPYKEICTRWWIEGAIAHGDYPDATKLLDGLLEANPFDLWAIRTLLSLTPHCREINEHELYERWLKVEPNQKKAVIGLAHVMLKEEEYEKALPLLHQWEYLSKKPVEACRGLVWALLNLGRYDDAQRYSDKVIGHATAVFDDYLNAGHIAFMQGRMKDAVKHYLRAVPLYKGDAPLDLPRKIHEVDRFLQNDKDSLRKIDLAITLDIVVRETKKRKEEKG